MRDLEITNNDRSVVEQPSQDRLLDLHRADAREPDRSRSASHCPVHDEELLRCKHDAGALPTPHGTHHDRRRHSQQDRTGDRGGPTDPDREATGNCQDAGTHESTGEHDSVPPLVDTDPFARRSDQGVAGFATRGRIPRS